MVDSLTIRRTCQCMENLISLRTRVMFKCTSYVYRNENLHFVLVFLLFSIVTYVSPQWTVHRKSQMYKDWKKKANKRSYTLVIALKRINEFNSTFRCYCFWIELHMIIIVDRMRQRSMSYAQYTIYFANEKYKSTIPKWSRP